MEKPGKVAIIMPVYNAAKFVEKTVQNILDQTYSNWELFAIDDGSTDNSLEILRRFTDPRIKIFSSEDKTRLKVGDDRTIVSIEKDNVGSAETRNKGLKSVVSSCELINDYYEYVAYCDSDDRWTNNHLKISVDELLKGSADMVYSDCDFVKEDGTVVTTWGVPYYDKFDRENLLKQNFIYISTVVHKVECLGVGNFDSYCIPMDDYDMWLRISKEHTVIHIPTVTATYMYKSEETYYTAEDSAKSKVRIHLKHSIIGDDLQTLKIQLEEMKEIKNNIVRSQRYEDAARARDVERQIITRIDSIEGPQAIDGWLSAIEGEALAEYGRDKNCLEIGSYKGKSSYYIATTAKSLVCIDSFRSDVSGQTQFVDYTTLKEFLKNTSKFKNVIPIIGKSEDVYGQFKDGQFDMMFIDGMHDYEHVSRDIKNYWPKLRIGGVMCFHDYQKDWPGVVQAIDEAFGKPDKMHHNVAVIFKTEAKIAYQGREIESKKEIIGYKLIRDCVQTKEILEGKFLLMKILHMTSDQVDKLPYNEFEGYINAVKTMGQSIGLPLDTKTVDPVEDILGQLQLNKRILVSPWSHKLPTGNENPKNFPYWDELIPMLQSAGCYIIQIGVAGEKLIGADEIVFNASFDRLKEILDSTDTFISVDSFFPHFAHYHKKNGIVIFSQSDPNLFGYSENVNILKSRDYLRKEQFWLWTQTEYNKAAFISSKEAFDKILAVLQLQ